MNFLQTSYKLLTNFLQTSYKLLTNFLQTSYKPLTNFIQNSYKTSYKLLTNFLQTSYKLLTNFLQTSYKLLLKFLQTISELFTNFLWDHYELLTNFLQLSYKLLMNFLQASGELLVPLTRVSIHRFRIAFSKVCKFVRNFFVSCMLWIPIVTFRKWSLLSRFASTNMSITLAHKTWGGLFSFFKAISAKLFYNFCGHANKFKAQPNPSVFGKYLLYTKFCLIRRHDKEIDCKCPTTIMTVDILPPPPLAPKRVRLWAHVGAHVDSKTMY